MKQGFVHIYTGEGKGKTTAALGLSMRAVGCGCKVCFFQFFKDPAFPCGEKAAIKRLGGNFKFKRFDIPHPMFESSSVIARTLPQAGAEAISKKLKKALIEVNRLINSGRFDLVILDEILIGVAQGFIDEKVILDIINNKPKTVELILTGRGASDKLINAADYVTYMKEVKHPFKKGVSARKGIEF